MEALRRAQKCMSFSGPISGPRNILFFPKEILSSGVGCLFRTQSLISPVFVLVPSLKSFWGRSGVTWSRSGVVLGLFWGRSQVRPRSFWACSGIVWCCPEIVLGSFQGRSEVVLGSSEAILRSFWGRSRVMKGS